MSKNAYLVLTDLHYASSKEHRVNYLNEVLDIVYQVLGVAYKYRERGYKVNLMLLGDVVDGSISQSDDAMRCQDLFEFIGTQFDAVYSVVGNHEQHNIRDNPFWFMVSQLDDDSLRKVNKPLQPKAVKPCIQVPATVTDGNVVFYFNHYDTPAKIPDAGVTAIGLFHQNVGSNDICKMWGTFVDVEQASFVHPYKQCYFGHMHMANGKYYLNDTKTCCGEWLGTCVGTTVKEVVELPREFNLPAVLVEEGELSCIEDNYILRSDPSTCIDHVRLKRSQEAKEKLSDVKSAVIRPLGYDSLFDRVMESAVDNDIGFLVDLLSMSYDNLRHEYRKGLSNVIAIQEE